MMVLLAMQRAHISWTRHILDASMSDADEALVSAPGSLIRQPPSGQQVGSLRGLGANHPDSRRGVIHRRSSGATLSPGAALHSKRGPGGTPFELLKNLLLTVRRTTQAGVPSPATPRIRRGLATSPDAAHLA